MPVDPMAAMLLAQQRQYNPAEDSRKQLALILQQNAQSFAQQPIRSPMEGIARALQTGVQGLASGILQGSQEARQRETTQGLLDYAKAPEGSPEQAAAQEKLKYADPNLVAGIAMQQLELNRARNLATSSANNFGAIYNQPPIGGAQSGGSTTLTTPTPQTMAPPSTAPDGGTDTAGNAIAGMEGGAAGYGAIGPKANAAGNQAYGKYQVMDFNIGPWTKQYLGQEMTPQQFLASPQAQEAVFKGEFGRLTQKYGPEGAARAWFAGEGGMNNPAAADVNGMTVAKYGQQFVQRGGTGPQGTQPIQPPSITPQLAGTPTAVPKLPDGTPVTDSTAAPVAGANVAATPPPTPAPAPAPTVSNAPPVVPMPVPTAEQITRYQRLMTDPNPNNRMSEATAHQELQKELRDRQQQLQTIATEAWKNDIAQKNVAEQNRVTLEQGTQKQFIDTRLANYDKTVRPAAVNAVNDMNLIYRGRQLLEGGAMAGPGTDARLKIANALGIAPDQSANTQLLQSTLAQRVLNNLGGHLGAGFSEGDRKFVVDMQGNTNWTKEGLQRLLAIAEQENKGRIDLHGQEAERLKQLPGLNKPGIAAQFSLPEVPSYSEWKKNNPLAPEQAPAPGSPAAPAAPTGGSLPTPSRPPLSSFGR